jgi:hypothetical protein
MNMGKVHSDMGTDLRTLRICGREGAHEARIA